MLKNQIVNETEFLLSIAMTKCGDLSEAQDLTQETLLSALLFLEKGGIIDNPRAFLSTLLNRKYYDMLRRKYQLPTVTIGEDFDIADDSNFLEGICKREEAEYIRREVTYLTQSYRSVIVRYYFHNQSVKEIAAELGLPVGTVKSRLDIGRKQVKKGYEEMDKYQENSYMPQYLFVQNSGIVGKNAEPGSLVNDDILAQNLLILAYEKPLTIGDLSKSIGVAAAYVEPVVNKLVAGELMKRMGDGKVYTDFIIYHANDHTKYIQEAEAFAAKHIKAYIEPLKIAIEELKETPFYSRRLERFMLILIAESGLFKSMESIAEKKQVLPDRPNGGKWIALGTIYPENHQISADKREKDKYHLAGRRLITLNKFLDATDIKIYNYESTLDPTGRRKHQGYGFNTISETESNMLKLFYLLKKKIDPENVALDTRMIKSIPLLEERGFITTQHGCPELLIPTLTHEEVRLFFTICTKARDAFRKNIKEPLSEWGKTHIKEIPPHLTSIPDQKRMYPYQPKPMMFVYEAISRGIHPLDLGYPCPETLVVWD
ncbi:MAG: sigma-70 family RNA polymerase sigma factor [Clostridia bacterium]|nr:sigma-70 family RNA polymerase sigma factor [Clostridia bacterium]